MKALLIFLVNALCMLQIIDTIKLVAADRMVRYIFNNGMEPTSTTACTVDDDAKIDALFGPTAVINRRELYDSDKVTTESDERKLYPLYCKNNCAGFAPKTCRATNCIGFRRDLERIDGIVEKERYLQTNLTCTAHMNLITMGLDSLISNNLISNTCKSYLEKTKRATSCYDDVIYGEILGMKVWDSRPQPATLMTNNLPATGYSFCSSVQFTMSSINHPCVDWVLFELTGPNGYNYTHTENDEPYSLFYDPFGQLDGNNVPPGLYTLKVTPDSQFSKTKVYQFNVNNCNDGYIYSDISAVQVWDSGPNPAVIMKDIMPSTGYSFCASKQFTMIALVQPVATWVVFQLNGTNGYNHTQTERNAPFTLFYDPFGHLDGQNVPHGSYTLKVLPNGQSSKARVYTFNVNNC